MGWFSVHDRANVLAELGGMEMEQGFRRELPALASLEPVHMISDPCVVVVLCNAVEEDRHDLVVVRGISWGHMTR